MRSQQTTTEPSPVITVKGFITAVNNADPNTNENIVEEVLDFLTTWLPNPVNRVIDVRTTASDNALPRWYRNVPWNSVNAIGGATINAPIVGDTVVLSFAGGNSSLPQVVGHLPGPSSLQKHVKAMADRPAAPSTVNALAFGFKP